MSLLQGGILLPAVIIAAVAASPLRPSSLRDTLLVLVGMIFMVALKTATNTNKGKHSRGHDHKKNNDDDDDEQHTIQTIEELRDLMPASASGSSLSDAQKVIGYLDDQMVSFIAKSPLLYFVTVDVTDGTPFVSPKGDEPGFVTVRVREGKPNQNKQQQQQQRQQHTLVIPDRPGNRLIFGLQNIVRHHDNHQSTKNKNHPSSSPSSSSSSSSSQESPPMVSILFEVPGTCTTLRCTGTARLSTDPALLQQHATRGCTPKLVILVDIDYAFFHCAKAYLRSRVWDPQSWFSEDERPKVGFGRYFARKGGILAKKIDGDIDVHYRQVQKAIDGEDCEYEA